MVVVISVLLIFIGERLKRFFGCVFGLVFGLGLFLNLNRFWLILELIGDCIGFFKLIFIDFFGVVGEVVFCLKSFDCNSIE